MKGANEHCLAFRGVVGTNRIPTYKAWQRVTRQKAHLFTGHALTGKARLSRLPPPPKAVVM